MPDPVAHLTPAPTNPSQSRVYSDGPCLVVEILGQHVEQQAIDCAASIQSHVDASTTKLQVIVDVTQLDGFSSNARSVWTRRFREIKPGIASIYMVGGGTLSRIAGSAMCLFSGITMRHTKCTQDALRLVNKS